MHEWKEGDLKSSHGDKVIDQKQAVAIAMSEAGVSKKETGKGKSSKTQTTSNPMNSSKKKSK